MPWTEYNPTAHKYWNNTALNVKLAALQRNKVHWPHQPTDTVSIRYYSRFLQGDEFNLLPLLSTLHVTRMAPSVVKSTETRGASIPKQATSQTAKIKWWQM